MKKSIFMFLAMALALVACKSDDGNTVKTKPKVSFSDTQFQVPKGCIGQVKLLLEAPVQADTEIPVTFSGTAVEGTDFVTVKNKFFVVLAGEKEAVLKIEIPNEITETKEVIITLGALPAGYEAGRFANTKVVSTLESTTIFSFANSKQALQSNQSSIIVELFKQDGTQHKVTEATDVAIVVDPMSTAVLGEHFKFTADKQSATFPKGKFQGDVSIEVLKYEKGKELIVLACGEPNGYFDGTNGTIKLTIDPIKGRIVGEWRGLVSYKHNDLALGYGLTAEQVNQLPLVLDGETMNFKADGTLDVTFTGKLANYFKDCNWEITGTCMLRGLTSLSSKDYLPVCTLSSVNRSFSAAAPNVKAVSVCVYMTSTPENPEILCVRLFGSYDGQEEASYDGEATDFYNIIAGDYLTYQFVRK